MKTSIAIMPSLPSSAGAGIASQRARKLAFSLIEFDHGTGDRPSYGGPAKRNFGYLHEIQEWADGQLEAVHDYIQWVFPLPERSGFNVAAPVLTRESIREFS